MTDLNSLPPAGWYSDSDPQQLRYWDGTAWTREVTRIPSGPGPVRRLQPTVGLSKALLAAIAAVVVADLVTGLALIGIASSPVLRGYLESDAMSSPESLRVTETVLLGSMTLGASSSSSLPCRRGFSRWCGRGAFA